MTKRIFSSYLIAAVCAFAVAPEAALARKAPSSAILAANQAATQRANDAMLLGALHEFSFRDGSLYAVQTSPQRITDIALEAGETLLSVSAGDTARWVVGDAKSGAGRMLQTHVLVKPAATGLATNLVIMTDRRVYHVELKSVSGLSMSAVSWRYGDDLIIKDVGADQKPRDKKSADLMPALVVSGVPADQLNFKYKISGDKPDWRPLRAFDDGRRVFIQMPENIGTTDAPPLFVMGENGPSLVNYRVRGQYYIVDRLFDRAELRLGDKRQKIVRIERKSKRKDNDNG